jgi:excinuclease ABC subunit C
MVTFVDGVPARGLYKKFKVRSVTNDDFAAMYEVLTRDGRFAGSIRVVRSGVGAPDLLVIDGGKGQLAMAVTALTDLGVKLGGDGVEVIGLAKERELEAGGAPDRIFRRNVKDSIPLRPNSPELYVLARIRDEAHRFANTFHQTRRSKALFRSELDGIPGIGATRRQKLLKHFGSVRAVRLASVVDLAKAPGMNRKAADAIAAYFVERAELEGTAVAIAVEYPNAATISGEISAGAVLLAEGEPGEEDDALTAASADSDDDANVEGRVGDTDVDAEIAELDPEGPET